MSSLDLSGLDKFSDLLKDPKDKKPQASGEPLALALDVIEEDPDQPRKQFDGKSLTELAASIKERGVKTPISVRPHPDKKGHYLVNHGARRYRAAEAAGLETIPAFVDTEHVYVDQLVENIQRETLTVMETVNAVAHLMDGGLSQAEVARQTGKSRTWVSRYAALRELPPFLAGVVERGQCQSVLAINTLLLCWDESSDAVETFVTERLAESKEGDTITDSAAKTLQAQIRRRAVGDAEGGEAVQGKPHGESARETRSEAGEAGAEREIEGQGGGSASEAAEGPLAGDNTVDAFETHSPEADEDGGSEDGHVMPGGETDEGQGAEKPAKVKKPQVEVKVGRREGILLLRKPCEYGLAWVEYEDGSEDLVDANKVKMVAVVDGKK